MKQKYKQKKAQGEIFGIALMFVLIIIGIIFYSQISALKDDSQTNTLQEKKYKILAESSLNSVLKLSTGCKVERDKDSIKDLINYCLENEFSGIDPDIYCDDGINHKSCKYAIELLNSSMFLIFNSSEGVINTPFELKMDIPANSGALLSNKSFSNFGQFKLKEITITEDNRKKYSYKRAPSGLISWATAQRNIEFELYLYYR